MSSWSRPHHNVHSIEHGCSRNIHTLEWRHTRWTSASSHVMHRSCPRIEKLRINEPVIKGLGIIDRYRPNFPLQLVLSHPITPRPFLLRPQFNPHRCVRFASCCTDWLSGAYAGTGVRSLFGRWPHLAARWCPYCLPCHLAPELWITNGIYISVRTPLDCALLTCTSIWDGQTDEPIFA